MHSADKTPTVPVVTATDEPQKRELTHNERVLMEETPDLEELDYSFLKQITEVYTPSLVPELSIDIFKSRYLDMLLRDQSPEEWVYAQYVWLKEVSNNPRTPVKIVSTGPNPEVLYVVPPLIGTVKTSFSGNNTSIDSRYRFMEQQKARLISSGKAVEKVLFDNINLVDESKEFWEYQMYRLLKDFGYLKHSGSTDTTTTVAEASGNLTDEISYHEDPDDFEY